MMKRVCVRPEALTVAVLALAVALVAALALIPAPAEAGGGQAKVTICHIPPGNPGNAHTITVGAPAVQAHIANHGDTIGPCNDGPGFPGGGDDDDDDDDDDDGGDSDSD